MQKKDTIKVRLHAAVYRRLTMSNQERIEIVIRFDCIFLWTVIEKRRESGHSFLFLPEIISDPTASIFKIRQSIRPPFHSYQSNLTQGGVLGKHLSC